MQTVFKGTYKTITNYQGEVASSPLQFAGVLSLNSSPTCFRLPIGFASTEGVYTVIETTGGISWNGSLLSPGDSLLGKISIDPPSGYAIRIDPYLDETGKKVKVSLRKSDESGAVHRISFDTAVVNAGQINEGVYVHVYDQSEDLQSKTLYYSASVLGQADFEDKVTTGSFVMTNGVGTFSKKIMADLNTEGDELLQFKISNDNSFSKIVGTTPVITVKDVSKSPTVTASSISVSEGEAVTVTVTFPAGSVFDSTYYYAIDSVSGVVNASDFTDGTINGSFAINSTTRIGTFTKTLKRDFLTEGSETFNVYIKSASISGTTIASMVISVSDSSRGTGSITAALACSSSPATEGQTLTFTFTDPDRQFGGTAYYVISGSGGFNQYDVSGNLASGKLTYAGTSATFTKTISNDYMVESGESFRVKVGPSLKQYFSLAIIETFGDTWNGGYGAIKVNGVTVTSLVLAEAAGPKFYNFEVSIGDVISFDAYGGTYAEDYFKLYTGPNGTGQLIYTSPTFAVSTTYTGIGNVTAVESYFDNAHDVAMGTFDSTFYSTLPQLNVNVIDNTLSSSPLSCAVSPSQSTYNEGSSVTFQLTDTTGYTGAIQYSIATVSGTVSSADFSSPIYSGALTGSISMTAGAGTLVTTLANDLATPEGEEVYVVNFSKSLGSVSIKAAAADGVTNSVPAMGAAGPTFNVYDGSTSNLLTTIASTIGTSYNLTGLTQNNIIVRITSAVTRTQLEVWSGANATGTKLNTIGGSFTSDFSTVIPLNSLVLTIPSANIRVNDTSYVNPATVAVSPTSYNEGSTLAVNVSNLADGTYYYTIDGTGIASSDFTSAFSGSFTVSGGVGTYALSLTLANDSNTEGAESFIVRIRSGSTTGSIIGSSPAITINDTSVASALTERIPGSTLTLVNGAYTHVTSVLGNYYFNIVAEWVFTAAELTAAGVASGAPIKGIKFYLSSPMASSSAINVSVYLKNTSYSTTSTVTETSGYTTCYSRSGFTASTTTVTSLTNPQFLFSSSGYGSDFTWDGVSNLKIKTVYKNASFVNAGASQYYSSGGSIRVYRTDTAGTYSASTATTASTTNARPKIGLLQ